MGDPPHTDSCPCMTCYMRWWRADLKKRLPHRYEKLKSDTRDYTTWWRVKQKFGGCYNLRCLERIVFSQHHIKTVLRTGDKGTVIYNVFTGLFNNNGDILDGNTSAFETVQFVGRNRFSTPVPLFVFFVQQKREKEWFNLYCILLNGHKEEKEIVPYSTSDLIEYFSGEYGAIRMQHVTDMGWTVCVVLKELYDICVKLKLAIRFSSNRLTRGTPTGVKIQPPHLSEWPLPWDGHAKLQVYHIRKYL